MPAVRQGSLYESTASALLGSLLAPQLENFDAGRYVGVPLLQAYDMAVEPPRRGRPVGDAVPFPHMLRWVR